MTTGRQMDESEVAAWNTMRRQEAELEALRAEVERLTRERDAQQVALSKIWVRLRALVGDVDYALNGDADPSTTDSREE